MNAEPTDNQPDSDAKTPGPGVAKRIRSLVIGKPKRTGDSPIFHKHSLVAFFGGQLVFPSDSPFMRWLHNAVVFAVQRRFYSRGIPFMILPIRVQ